MGVHIHPGKGTWEPQERRVAPTVPNITTAKEEHSNCFRRSRSESGRLGDVRYCQHGKIQVLVVPEYSGMRGPGTWVWSTLSPVWDYAKYRKARKALG